MITTQKLFRFRDEPIPILRNIQNMEESSERFRAISRQVEQE